MFPQPIISVRSKLRVLSGVGVVVGGGGGWDGGLGGRGGRIRKRGRRIGGANELI